MEVMEDGNLMDKVTILIQRDVEYYKNNQKVLQETICAAAVGGHLDFPRYASFAAVKLVLWWEEEFVAAYRRNSGFIRRSMYTKEENKDVVIKSSDPLKFVNLIATSADQLLDHLHVLTQEALDHADLSVLTGTIGAAALLKNCIWCYVRSIPESNSSVTEQLHKAYKKYQEMVEALAERLLDLHCRLLSLYILQDADSLDWENKKPFCEMERGSYIIQMWWLYMQGTKESLWNTVPPKMAQRIFAGMLNESLTILCARYLQALPSENRTLLLMVDISNILMCVTDLLSSICENATELLGLCLHSKSKVLRDIHSKCQDLLVCLVLRGSPLDLLYKAFRRGTEGHRIFQTLGPGPSPWIMLVLHNAFPDYPRNLRISSDLSSTCALTLEVTVLLAQPQPNWALLFKVLVMRDYKILNLILNAALKDLQEVQRTCVRSTIKECNGFLCQKDDTCRNDGEDVIMSDQRYYNIIASATHIYLCTGNTDQLAKLYLPIIDKVPGWACCFDRKHVWSQKRPPWYQAMVELVKPLLPPIVETVINAVRTGASMYQAMSLVLACFVHQWDCISPVLPRIASLIQDILPVDVSPLRHSVLLQMLISALYTELISNGEADAQKSIKFLNDQTKMQEQNFVNKMQDTKADENFTSYKSLSQSDGVPASTESIALAVAEALCSIDEDNKHTEQIDEFLEYIKKDVDLKRASDNDQSLEQNSILFELLASNLLMTDYGTNSLKILFDFIKQNKEWVYQNLGANNNLVTSVTSQACVKPKPLLHTMFHIDGRSFDQLLTGEWKPKWTDLLNSQMGISSDKAWSQVSLRWEFQDSQSTSLSAQDASLVTDLTKILKQMS